MLSAISAFTRINLLDSRFRGNDGVESGNEKVENWNEKVKNGNDGQKSAATALGYGIGRKARWGMTVKELTATAR